jgi:hypothetical protein
VQHQPERLGEVVGVGEVAADARPRSSTEALAIEIEQPSPS